MDIKRTVLQQPSLNSTEKTVEAARLDSAATKQAGESSSEGTTKPFDQTSSKSKITQVSELKNQGSSKVAELKSKFTASPGAQRAGLPDLDSTNSEIVSDNTKAKGALEFAHKLESLKVDSLAKRAEMLPLSVKQQAQVAGKKLALELPKMITRAQGDPDKLIARVQETLPTTNFAILGSMPDGDIEALAFLVLMEASKSAQEDLKAIMASVKSINQAKAQLRTELNQLGSYSRKAKKKDDDD